MKQDYSIKNPRIMILYSFILIQLVPTEINNHDIIITGLHYFKFLYSILIIFLLFLRYNIIITQDKITYNIRFININIYNRIIYPNQIKKITIKRNSWSSRLALIKTKKKLSILIVSSNDKLYQELSRFTEENKVILKIKDYITLNNKRK